MFFLSLLKEFRKIPDHLQMQSKMDILKVIKNAQDIDYPIPNSFRVNQILHYSGNSPYTHHTNVSEVERESSPQGYQWGTEFRSSCLHAATCAIYGV